MDLVKKEKIRLLHLDDDEVFRELFEAMFDEFFSIDSVEDHNQAIELLDKNNYDAVVIDFDLAGLDGIKLTKDLKARYPDTAFILLTGKGNEETARNAFLSGGSDYFNKDVASLEHRDSFVKAVNMAVRMCRLEMSKRETEEKYRNLVENLNEGIVTMDEKYKVTFFNRRMLEMTGRKEDQLQGVNLLDFITDDKKDKVYALLEDLKLGRIHRLVFETGMKSKGSPLNVRIAASSIIDPKGGYSGIRAAISDITPLKKIEKNLKDSQDQLRMLSRHLNEILERERTTIARNLHDDLGQVLTALKMDIYSMSRRIDKKDEVALKKSKSALELIDQGIQKVKNISADLRPAMLDSLGLVSTLEWALKRLKDRSGIEYKLNNRVDPLIIGPRISSIMYRVFQEIITNIMRHSQADRVTVILKKGRGSLEMIIRDNGVGITREQITSHASYGIIGMKERLNEMNGSVYFHGEPGKGTTVSVNVPLISEETIVQ